MCIVLAVTVQYIDCMMILNVVFYFRVDPLDVNPVSMSMPYPTILICNLSGLWIQSPFIVIMCILTSPNLPSSCFQECSMYAFGPFYWLQHCYMYSHSMHFLLLWLSVYLTYFRVITTVNVHLFQINLCLTSLCELVTPFPFVLVLKLWI